MSVAEGYLLLSFIEQWLTKNPSENGIFLQITSGKNAIILMMSSTVTDNKRFDIKSITACHLNVKQTMKANAEAQSLQLTQTTNNNNHRTLLCSITTRSRITANHCVQVIREYSPVIQH